MILEELWSLSEPRWFSNKMEITILTLRADVKTRWSSAVQHQASSQKVTAIHSNCSQNTPGVAITRRDWGQLEKGKAITYNFESET